MPLSDSILYFPGIEFATPSWVRAALLIWDSVYRIVPEGYVPQDSSDTLEAVNAGLIHNITLEPDDLASTHDGFQKFLCNIPFMPAGLQGSHRVHKDKIDARLYPILDKVATHHVDKDWFQLPSELARGYMFYLAQNAARRRGLYKGTDTADAWVVSYYFSERGNFDDFVYDTSEGSLSYLNIKDLIPISVANVPMSQVIEFLEKRKDEKRNFREQVNRLLGKVALCESKSHLVELFDACHRDLLEAKQALRRSMSFASVDDLYALFVIAVPVAATVLGTLATYGHPGVAAIATALSFGAVAGYAQFAKAIRANRSANTGAYLLDLDNRLAREGRIWEFDRIMNEFVND
jgi:hypothetical protein